MIYDLEETNEIEDFLDTIIEMSEIKTVTVDDKSVNICVKTYAGNLTIVRNLDTDRLSVQAE